MVARLLVVAFAFALAAAAQPAVTIRAGLIYDAEGDIFLDDQPLRSQPAKFVVMPAVSELRSEDGRVTVLLNPGASLELEQHSSVRMITTALDNTDGGRRWHRG